MSKLCMGPRFPGKIFVGCSPLLLSEEMKSPWETRRLVGLLYGSDAGRLGLTDLSGVLAGRRLPSIPPADSKPNHAAMRLLCQLEEDGKQGNTLMLSHDMQVIDFCLTYLTEGDCQAHVFQCQLWQWPVSLDNLLESLQTPKLNAGSFSKLMHL